MPQDICPQCKEDLYIVEGLCTEHDAIRSNRWCEECKVMYSCHAHGLVRRLVLKDRFEGTAKERIRDLLQTALIDLK